MSNLYAKIYEIVKQVPEGQVASYGQIARLVDMPHGARPVGWALRAMPKGQNIPWQRVIAKDARISIVNPEHSPDEQCNLLMAEGNTVEEQQGSWYVMQPKWFEGN